MKLSTVEKETIILFNEGEEWAEVYTYNNRLKKRLREYAGEYPAEAQMLREEESGSVTWRVRKKRITIAFTKPFTPERRDAYRQRGLERAKSRDLSPVLEKTIP